MRPYFRALAAAEGDENGDVVGITVPSTEEAVI